MNKVLYIILISLFSLTFISCSSSSSSGGSSTTSTTDDDTTTTTDTTAPVIAEVTAVKTPTNDTTPDYTFSSTEAGTITYGGSCSSTTSAISGNNTVTFNTLSVGTYSENCSIKVTDLAGNISNTLNVSTFIIAYAIQGTLTYDYVPATSSYALDYDNITSKPIRGAKVNLIDSATSSTLATVTSSSSGTYSFSGISNSSVQLVIYAQMVTPSVIIEDNTNSDAVYGGITSAINLENELYVAIGGSRTILTSSDNGTTWTTLTSGTSGYRNGITLGNSNFVVVGESGEILTSSDGTTWTSRTSGTTNQLQGVTYGNGNFVAVGWSGTILTSSDNGTTWTIVDPINETMC